MPLTSKDIAARIGAAIEAEQAAALHLRRTSTAAVLAGDESPPEEVQARRAHADAAAAVERLQNALSQVQASEATSAARLVRDTLDAHDAGTLAALHHLEVIAERTAKSIAAYVQNWVALLDAANNAREKLSLNPRLRPDLLQALPNLNELVTHEITRLSAEVKSLPPGANGNLKVYGYVGDLPTIVSRINSVSTAGRQDLAKYKAIRDAQAARDAADEWSVVA